MLLFIDLICVRNPHTNQLSVCLPICLVDWFGAHCSFPVSQPVLWAPIICDDCWNGGITFPGMPLSRTVHFPEWYFPEYTIFWKTVSRNCKMIFCKNDFPEYIISRNISPGLFIYEIFSSKEGIFFLFWIPTEIKKEKCFFALLCLRVVFNTS